MDRQTLYTERVLETDSHPQANLAMNISEAIFSRSVYGSTTL